jgi:ribosome-binding protein aMBF1 (putative translation factor)
METTIIVSDDRKVIRCKHCSLNQFATLSGNCRRCAKPYEEPPKQSPPPMPPSKPIEWNTDGMHRTFNRKNQGPFHYVVPDVATAMKIMRRVTSQSQRELALRIRVPRTYISKIENHQAEPNITSIDKIASGFGMSPSDLVSLAMIASEAQ